jgi:aminopeptidase
MDADFFRLSNNKQVVFHAPGEKELCKNLSGGIYLLAPESLTHLRNIDPKKISKAAIARKTLRDILQAREDAGEFGWTLCIMPTEEMARQAKLTMNQYSNQVKSACFLDLNDPVKEWTKIYRKANELKKWINSFNINWIHIESDNIDLIITPGDKRQWVGMTGHNIPSFEIYISPDWRGTKGIYYADQPSFRSGNYVEEIRLEFKKGKVVEVKAKKGKKFVADQIGMDPGAGRVGEFSLTDKRFSKIDRFMANTLFDENYGGKYGNCHIAVGSSYPDSYNGDTSKLTRQIKNELGFNDSALHWDLVNTEKKTVTACLTSGEKKVIYENGIFNY